MELWPWRSRGAKREREREADFGAGTWAMVAESLES